jgi:hypothetical protein
MQFWTVLTVCYILFFILFIFSVVFSWICTSDNQLIQTHISVLGDTMTKTDREYPTHKQHDENIDNF